jgi:chitinase
VFSPYKDITTSNVMGSAVSGTQHTLTAALPAAANTVTLGFATGECGAESWAGLAGSTFASANVPKLVAAGKYYIISTGGAAAKERGPFTCGSAAGFATFLSRYMSPFLLGVDFDIESGQSTAQISTLVARAKEASAQYPNMRFT